MCERMQRTREVQVVELRMRAGELRRRKLAVVSFSARSCMRCAAAEGEYADATARIMAFGVDFLRVDAAKERSIVSDFGAMTLPALKICRSGHCLDYSGTHAADEIVRIVRKVADPPSQELKTVAEVREFLHISSDSAANPVFAISFFTGGDDDELEDYMVAARQLQVLPHCFFAHVVDSKVSAHFAGFQNGEHFRAPAAPSIVLLSSDGSEIEKQPLDEFRGDLAGWVKRNSLPLAGELTGGNFHLYESRGLPMLILFLDFASPKAQRTRLIDDLATVAKSFRREIAFAYADGVAFKDRLRALGIVGGVEALPSVAFNTKDGLMRALAPRENEELFDKDGKNDDVAVVSTTDGTFQRVAMDETKDVLLAFHDESTASLHFAPYYKRVAKRFKELGIESVVIARMDVTHEPPPHLFDTPSLPTLVFLPAYAKEAPFQYYSGVAKVRPMMDFVAKHAAIRFHMGELPQFNDADKKLYKEQIAQLEARKTAL
eukprot:g639.t1